MSKRYTSANRHYWNAAIEALNQVHLYINLVKGNCDADDFIEIALSAAGSPYPHPADYVRYVLFPEAVDHCRYIYETYCASSKDAFFGIRDEYEADQFFHEMLLNWDRLAVCDAIALANCSRCKKAIPLCFIGEAV